MRIVTNVADPFADECGNDGVLAAPDEKACQSHVGMSCYDALVDHEIGKRFKFKRDKIGMPTSHLGAKLGMRKSHGKMAWAAIVEDGRSSNSGDRMANAGEG